MNMGEKLSKLMKLIQMEFVEPNDESNQRIDSDLRMLLHTISSIEISDLQH